MLPFFVEYIFSSSQPESMPKFVKKVITKMIKDQPPRMTVDEKRLVREMHFERNMRLGSSVGCLAMLCVGDACCDDPSHLGPESQKSGLLGSSAWRGAAPGQHQPASRQHAVSMQSPRDHFSSLLHGGMYCQAAVNTQLTHS